MAKNSIDVYGASGKTNVLNFEPENLHLVTDKTHPLYDERVHLPIEEGMVLNIAELGVLEPIIVWKDPETGLSCVVDGRQRVRHTLEANKRLLKEGKEPLLVPAVAKRGSAVRMAQAMVSANEIRQADTPLGRAKKMADALERGHDEDDLALMFGVNTPDLPPLDDESHAVTVENLQESAYRAGLTAGWNLGLANNNEGFNKCLAAHTAGFKVKAE